MTKKLAPVVEVSAKRFALRRIVTVVAVGVISAGTIAAINYKAKNEADLNDAVSVKDTI